MYTMMYEILWSLLVLNVWLKKILSFTTIGVYTNIFFQSYTQNEII